MKAVKRNILLNPGPATTTDSVKFAQVVPDICPRESEFGLLMEYICTELTQIAADCQHYATVLFAGSGTAAVESILSSIISDADTALIVNNGAYGKRMCEIAAAYGLHFLEFQSPAEKPVDLKLLQRFIENSPDNISHLAVVHNETTTGLLNNIEAIGEICKTYRIDLIVDAMSSFAAIPVQMDLMNISFLAASSNKNLQGIAGTSFVIADKTKLDCLEGRTPRNYYLNLYSQYKHFVQTRQMRFTPPVQTLYALRQAIEEFKQEGLGGRYARYAKSWETLIKGLSRLGLKHIVDEKNHSKLVTSIIEPDCAGYDFQMMHDFFYARGFTIYPGKLEQLNTFRIANIGDITHTDIEAFVEIMDLYLSGIGYNEGRPSHEDIG